MKKGRLQNISPWKSEPLLCARGKGLGEGWTSDCGLSVLSPGSGSLGCPLSSTQRWTRWGIIPEHVVSQKEGFPVSRTSSRGGGGSGKRLLPSSLAPPPNSSAHAILRTQIMPAVAVAHISFQKHPALRGPALPPSLARWPLCQVGASCSLCLPHPAGHTDSGHGQ